MAKLEIKRDFYLNKLTSRMHNGLIKVVTGIRRCGKSYLLFNIFYRYLISVGVPKEKIITIDLEDLEYVALRDKMALFEYIKSRIDDSQQWYLLIDEIQNCLDFEQVLTSFVKKDNIDIYVTGSNSKFLSSDVITEFRGRGDIVQVYPLSFSEFVSVYQGDVREAWKDYYYYGGMPHVLTITDPKDKISYLADHCNFVYLKDIVERHKLKGDSVMSTLLDVLSSNIGSLNNPNKLANTFKSKGINTNEVTISQYIDYFLDSFIISKAKRFDIKGKKYIGSPFKYYFVDMGLRNARLNYSQLEETHIMENIIYNELLIRGYKVDVGLVEKYQKNESGNYVKKFLEVDFVCNTGNNRYYIQSALSIPNLEKMEQEQNSLVNIDDYFKKIIVVKDDIKLYHNEKGILIINLFDFLLNQNSLDL